MNRTLTEQKVLKNLGIPDFRHMTREKVTGFVSMLPRMDPEVAKKALEQFPDFTKTAQTITASLKEGLEQLVGPGAGQRPQQGYGLSENPGPILQALP